MHFTTISFWGKVQLINHGSQHKNNFCELFHQLSGNLTLQNDLQGSYGNSFIWRQSLECFHMTSRRSYWCPKTLKRRPCWCPKPIFWELNSLLGPSPFQGCPVINSVFGRLCKKTVPRGREDKRVWYRETMFSQVVSYDFPLPGLLHEYFLYLVSAPRNPEGIANLKKAICVVRSDSIIGVTL